MAHPIIIYIPGLLPKPEAGVHRDALFRCLLAGMRRIDVSVADAIEATARGFEIIPWTYDFYLAHRDIELDRSGIEAVIEQATWANCGGNRGSFPTRHRHRETPCRRPEYCPKAQTRQEVTSRFT